MGVNDHKTARLCIRGVCKSFGDKTVLRGLSLDVRHGENVVVIGRSGSGKSVLLKSVLGLSPPDCGSIKVDGEETVGVNSRDHERINRKVGMLFQGAALFDSLPIWENISFRLLYGDERVSRRHGRELAVEMLSQVGLSKHVADMFPADLSGGMQKRVGLARAIASRPEIIFLDEPTTGLDRITVDAINNLIVECVKDIGATALSITHDIGSALKIADRLALLWNGEVAWTGPVAEALTTEHPHVRAMVHGTDNPPSPKTAH